MIHELTEMVATWLDDPTYGVNALLGEVPRLETDDPPSAIEAICHGYQDDWITQDKDPPYAKSLVVAVGADIEARLATGMPTGVITGPDRCVIGVFLVTRDGLGARAWRDASYTCRAVRQSLQRLGSEVGGPSTTLRDTVLVDMGKITEVPIGRTAGEHTIAGMTLATCSVSDTAP